MVKGFARDARRSAKAGLRYAGKGVNRTVLNDPVSPYLTGEFSFDLPPRGRGAGSLSRVAHDMHAGVIGTVQPAMIGKGLLS